ncbi:MAG: RcnB family protein, partial [Croceibacterium sp.]
QQQRPERAQRPVPQQTQTQQPTWRGDRNQGGEVRRDDRQRGGQSGGQSGGQTWGQSGDRNDYRRDDYRRDAARDGRRDGRTESRDGYRDGSRGGSWSQNRDQYQYRDGRRGDDRQWNRTWRQDRRYDWNSYRRSNRSTFNLGIYYSPYRSYSYRRMGIGVVLQSLFYSNRYWINDPWQYRLPEVYGPYRWVRYYDDVLLVDIYSGEVVDVIYDFFW